MAAIVRQHLDAPSMWAVFPLQDLLALSPAFGSRPAAEETINDPTNSRHYWRFRVHIPLEDILADAKFLGDIQALLLGALPLQDALCSTFSHHASGFQACRKGW